VIFDGYYGNPEETVASCRNLWYHTDDLGYFDGEGRLRFVGRKGNSVRVKGHFVPVEHVESTIERLPWVDACAIVGVPADIGEETVKAFVVPVDGVESPDPEELVTHCESSLASYMVPRYVEFLYELPRGEALFKVRKNELRERDNVEAWDRLGSDER
jgi:crotonobetaine/carnitine-CoA ligase